MNEALSFDIKQFHNLDFYWGNIEKFTLALLLQLKESI